VSPAPSTTVDISSNSATPEASPAAAPDDLSDNSDSGAMSLTSKAVIGGIVGALMAIGVF